MTGKTICSDSEHHIETCKIIAAYNLLRKHCAERTGCEECVLREPARIYFECAVTKNEEAYCNIPADWPEISGEK